MNDCLNHMTVKTNCNAKTRAGMPCNRRPAIGRQRCKLHGGASLRGKDHWAFKDGSQTREIRAHEAAGIKRLRELIKVAKSLGMLR